jgi:hypothetical protein
MIVFFNLQKQAAKRGSGEVSLKDLGKLDDLIDSAKQVKSEANDVNSAEGESLRYSVDELAVKIERLQQKIKEDGETEKK